MPAAIRAEREHEPHGLVSETADGERERGSGWSVEPLDVVHDHQHGPRARALAQEGEEGRETAPRSRAASGSSRSSATARARRWGAGSFLAVSSYACSSRSRNPANDSLDRGPRATTEHADRSVPRRIDHRVQQGALPDAGRPLDDEGAWPRMNTRDEPL